MLESEKVSYSAPGKLFFFGEYGVLAGGWTVVAAMNRRVGAVRWREARGYRAVGAGGKATLGLPGAVVATLSGLGAEDRWSVGHFESDVRSFFEGGQKLGLGSSAASVVALSAAGLHREGVELSADGVFEVAFSAHRRLQGGRGSGADVAASAYGGLLAYRLDAATPPFGELAGRAEFENERRLAGVRVVPGLRWPEGLEFRAVWTGKSASSTGLIARVEAVFLERSDVVAAVFLEIGQVAEAAIRALLGGSAEDVVGHFARADFLMEKLGELSGAPIVTEQHRVIRRVAAGYGVVAKPSGAGGGDFSLLVGPRGTRWEVLAGELPAGCSMIDLEIDPLGVLGRQAGD